MARSGKNMVRRISFFFLLFSLTMVGLLALQALATDQGTIIELNGQPWNSQWLLQRSGQQRRLFVQDNWFRSALGATLLNSEEPNRQRYEWFSSPAFAQVTFDRPVRHRFLQIDSLSSTWRTDMVGNTLKIFTPDAFLKDLRRSTTPQGERLTLELSRSTPWQMAQQDSTFKIAVAAEWAAKEDLKKLTAPSKKITAFTIRQERKQVLLEMQISPGFIPKVSTLSNPPRLVLDLMEGYLPPPRRIAWHPGVVWREEWVTLSEKMDKNKSVPKSENGQPQRFFFHALEIDPKQPGITLRPIWASKEGMTGKATLAAMAEQAEATAAINGGFFNRDRSLPVGPIKRGNWYAGPVLDRGVVAWNDQGMFLFNRMEYGEKLVTDQQITIPLTHLNSGYVQKGVARYLPTWGIYTPLTDTETIFTIRQNKVISSFEHPKSGPAKIAPPEDGYLLVSRQAPEISSLLPLQSTLKGESTTQPPEFNNFPYLLGAGPLLLKKGKVVLDAAKEGFSGSFVNQKAPRSGIALLKNGHLLLGTFYQSPTLKQTAEILQKLGAVDALNLDGGGSTGLWLGGSIRDRGIEDLRPIHNALGVFINPPSAKETF